MKRNDLLELGVMAGACGLTITHDPEHGFRVWTPLGHNLFAGTYSSVHNYMEGYRRGQGAQAERVVL